MNTEIKPLKKNCVISTVGKNSFHREWAKESSDFDLHLIVYDDSFDKFYKDTDFICSQKGYKFRLVYNYLQANPEYLKHYEYFFLPDDDIQIDSKNISKLFQLMRNYQLQIAQPGLSSSYYSYKLFLRDKFCLLRYTNFVEMMLPCFSREALKKVLPSFNANHSGWGIDHHWAKLIHFTGKEMAILDEIHAVHTRPVQSYNPENQKEYNEYTQKYDLDQNFIETGFISTNPPNIKSERFIQDRNLYKLILGFAFSIAEQSTQRIRSVILSQIGIEGATGVSLFLIHYSRLSEKREYHDMAMSILDVISNRLGWLKDDLSFSTGLPGFSWYIEYLAQHRFIENDTDEILEEICEYLNNSILEKTPDYGINELLQVIPHYIARTNNPNFNTDIKLHHQEEQILTGILQKVCKWNETLSIPQKEIEIPTLTKSILLLCQAKKTLNLPEIDSILQKLILILEDSAPDDQLPYLLKIYLLILASESTHNEALKNQTILQAKEYKDYCKDIGFQKLLNIYLLHKIHLHTKEEIIKVHALEILHSLIENSQKENDFLTYINRSSKEDNTIETYHLIRTGLILISILSEKDPELDLCIL